MSSVANSSRQRMEVDWLEDDVCQYIKYLSRKLGRDKIDPSLGDLFEAQEISGAVLWNISKQNLKKILGKQNKSAVKAIYDELVEVRKGTIALPTTEEMEAPDTSPCQHNHKHNDEEKKEPSAPRSWMDVLAENEQQNINMMLNNDMDHQMIISMFAYSKEKKEAVESMIMAMVRPPLPPPTDRKTLTVDVRFKPLPLYHYTTVPSPMKRYYTLLVIGQTGSGKTTLLDAFVNCLMGQRLTDNWRWKLVDENEKNKKKSGSSHTSEITDYYIHDERGDSGKECHLRIIDTPGFGDTSGIEQDDKIVKQFERCFKEINELDYILVTVKASETRWTHGNRYIYDRVQQIFGRNAADRFVLMCTFADGAEPVALKTLEGNLHFDRYFTFNNSALYMPFKPGAGTTKNFWNMCMSSVSVFLDYIVSAGRTPLSMHQSTEVLRKREWLFAMIGSAQKRIDDGFVKLDQMYKTREDMKKQQHIINVTGKYTKDIWVEEKTKQDLGGVYQMCDRCQTVCCQICQWPANALESQCTYFNGGRGCPKCRGNCPREAHVRTTYKYVTTQVKKTVVDTVKKEENDLAQSGLSASQVLLARQKRQMTSLSQDILSTMKRVKESLAELERIAMKPRVFTDVQYFEEMIKTEEEGKKPGWQSKVKALHNMKKRAEHLHKLETTDNVKDLFPSYQKMIDEELSKDGKSNCIVM